MAGSLIAISVQWHTTLAYLNACVYVIWQVEWYTTLGNACGNCPIIERDCHQPECIYADGVRRTVVVVNRMLPGPSIEVCQGDTIVIDVENHLLGEGITVHWHGLRQQGSRN